MMCADLGGKNGKGKFSYVDAFTGAGYGSFGKSSATVAYGMGMGMGKGGGGKVQTIILDLVISLLVVA